MTLNRSKSLVHSTPDRGKDGSKWKVWGSNQSKKEFLNWHQFENKNYSLAHEKITSLNGESALLYNTIGAHTAKKTQCSHCHLWTMCRYVYIHDHLWSTISKWSRREKSRDLELCLGLHCEKFQRVAHDLPKGVYKVLLYPLDLIYRTGRYRIQPKKNNRGANSQWGSWWGAFLKLINCREMEQVLLVICGASPLSLLWDRVEYLHLWAKAGY